MTIDSLLGAKLVLASGEILPVNEVENPDLFWAIRGNFSLISDLTKRWRIKLWNRYGTCV